MTMSSLVAHQVDQRAFVKKITHRRTWHGLRGLSLVLSLLVLGGCEAGQSSATGPATVVAANTGTAALQPEESHMWMTVGERRFAITLTNNPAARAFAGQLPLTLDMADLNSNEKHAELPKALPVGASRPGTIRSGDLMLYGSSTLVVFYVTFDSSYSYTRLGRVDDADGLAQALGQRTVRINFSKK